MSSRSDGAEPGSTVPDPAPHAGPDVEPDAGPDDLPEQIQVRLAKRDRLLAAGVEPYPVGVEREATLAEIRERFAELPADTSTGEHTAVAGRVLFRRDTGKLCFATLHEGSGAELQVMLSAAKVGAERLAAWKSDVDLGDLVSVTGEVITSRRGELSVLADDFRIATKALRPLPVAHRPLSEQARVRRRSVDLIMRPEARRVLDIRVAAVRALRESLQRRGFAEVETPMLQLVHGGAAARPFGTHVNAFDLDVYLRIALELHLKRLVVGGVERVFEIGRVLRNEGADSTHSPEFTMLEAYQAYGDYDSMAVLTRELYQEVATAVFGADRFTRPDGVEVDLGGEWHSVSLYRSVSEALGEPIDPETPLEVLRGHAERVGVSVDPAWVAGKIVEQLLEELCGSVLAGPVFVRDYPIDTSPLTRPHRSRSGVAEKWDLYIGGVERATAYSELTDPVLQRERLTEQARAAAGGDAEAMGLDEDFLSALEHGMPPTGGMGMGVDRMLQVLTGLGIRETIPFPFVRPG